MENNQEPSTEPAPQSNPVSTAEELVLRAEKAADRLEAANKRAEARLASTARAALHGRAEAGQEPAKPSPEETLKADIKKWMPAELLPDNLR